MTEQTVYRNVYAEYDGPSFMSSVFTDKAYADEVAKVGQAQTDFVYRLNITPKGKE